VNVCAGGYPKIRCTIRPFTTDDLDEVLLIEAASFARPWVREMFEAELDRSDISRCFIAGFIPRSINEDKGRSGVIPDSNDKGEIAGYIMSWLVADELYITNLAVSPARRKTGVADSLIEHALQDAREHGATWCQLEVRVSNTPARTLYEKNGFREIGVRRGYYQDGEDAAVMGMELVIRNPGEDYS